MAASARRHYRVAKKEVQLNPEKGIFIPEIKNKPMTILFAAVAAAMCTLGFLAGITVNKCNWRNK